MQLSCCCNDVDFRWVVAEMASERKDYIMFQALMLFAAFVPYPHVQSTPLVSAAPGSRFVSLTVQLRNIGGIATACIVKASGQKRRTGISANGTAEVTFDALAHYNGYTVTCNVN